MLLYLMRHGEAEAPEPGRFDEFNRPLTALGRTQVEEAARGLQTLAPDLQQVLTSPLPRAKETAQLIAAAYAPARPVQELAALRLGTAIADLCEEVMDIALSYRELLVVGHQPELQQLAYLLLSEGVKPITLGCAAVASIEILPPSEEEEPLGKLLWHLTAKQLALGRVR